MRPAGLSTTVIVTILALTEAIETPMPCGMPKTANLVSNLVSSSAIQFLNFPTFIKKNVR